MRLNALIVCLMLLARSYAQDSLALTREGVHVGLGIGTWFPDNKNKILGHPLMLDVRIDYRRDFNSFSFNFDLIGIGINKTKQPMRVKLNDSTVTVNDYFASQIVLEYGRVLYSRNRFSFEVNCGLGKGELSYYNPTSTIDIKKASLIVNPGVSFGLFAGKRDLVQLKVQYYLANYRLKDGVSTDLKGNYLETKLVWTGSFSSW